MWRMCANNAGLVMGFDIYNEIFIEIVKKNFEIKKKTVDKILQRHCEYKTLELVNLDYYLGYPIMGWISAKAEPGREHVWW